MDEEWILQIKRGTLEYVILVLIRNKERYGYDLIQILENYPLLKAKESTIYPLLRRLLKKGYLDAYWQNMGEGVPDRKYYMITRLGIAYLNQLDEDWHTLSINIAELKKR